MTIGSQGESCIRLRYVRTTGILLLAVACIAVRCIALDADPPPWLSWSSGIFTDEGFYTLDARHEALFGTWAPGDFHDRLLAPLLSLLQQGVFAVFGADRVQARCLSVAFGLLTLLVFWLGLRAAYGARAALYGVLLLGLAPPVVFYNRLALQETPAIFWLVLAFTLWAVGIFCEQHRRRVLLLCLAGASLALSALFKPLALLALPALFLHRAASVDTARWRGTGRDAPELWSALGFGCVALLYGLIWYGPHAGEIGRMTGYYRLHQMQPHSALGLYVNIRRGLLGGARGVLPYLVVFLPVPCSLALRQIAAWCQWNRADAFFVIWLACGLAFCLASSYAPDRYYVLFLPALIGLAAPRLAAQPRTARIVIVALFFLTSGFWYARAWAGRSEAMRDASRQLSRLLPPGSRMIGNDAPSLCLGTSLSAAPVQEGLSNDDHPVERLHADYVAVTRAPVWEQWWRNRYPEILRPSHRIATYVFGGARAYTVDVYSVHGAKQVK